MGSIRWILCPTADPLTWCRNLYLPNRIANGVIDSHKSPLSMSDTYTTVMYYGVFWWYLSLFPKSITDSIVLISLWEDPNYGTWTSVGQCWRLAYTSRPHIFLAPKCQRKEQGSKPELSGSFSADRRLFYCFFLFYNPLDFWGLQDLL